MSNREIKKKKGAKPIQTRARCVAEEQLNRKTESAPDKQKESSSDPLFLPILTQDKKSRVGYFPPSYTRPWLGFKYNNAFPFSLIRRVLPADGKCMACTYRVKFIEVSVGINHNVDHLLVGILNQIRLKKAGNTENRTGNGASEGSGHWYKSRGVVRASMKARQMLTWLFGKEDSKFKNCENLHVL